MDQKQIETVDTLDIREMTIDDFAEVFHLGEELFTSDYSSSMYRTWDEYEITTLYNSDSELCLVAELDEEIVGFALGLFARGVRWSFRQLRRLGPPETR